MKSLMNEKQAMSYAGPSFEEMTDIEMMETDAEATPTFLVPLSWSVVKVTASALTGVAFTFTVDKIFNGK